MATECDCPRCIVDRALRGAGVHQARLHSREETARILGGVSVDLVDELYHSGRLAGMTIGRRRFHSDQAIERFIEANEGLFGDGVGGVDRRRAGAAV